MQKGHVLSSSWPQVCLKLASSLSQVALAHVVQRDLMLGMEKLGRPSLPCVCDQLLNTNKYALVHVRLDNEYCVLACGPKIPHARDGEGPSLRTYR